MRIPEIYPVNPIIPADPAQQLSIDRGEQKIQEFGQGSKIRQDHIVQEIVFKFFKRIIAIPDDCELKVGQKEIGFVDLGHAFIDDAGNICIHEHDRGFVTQVIVKTDKGNKRVDLQVVGTPKSFFLE